MNKIGFFGGCFNPVTNAHINLIKEVAKKEKLSKVYFVPMGDFYKKEDLISLDDRIEMLKIAFENDEKFDILKISNITHKTSAIDTFQKIDELFKSDNRFFIMGSDNFNQIQNWENGKKLVNDYNYIVLDRENEKNQKISSSLVRKKIKENKDVENLISPEVFNYIKQKNLYK